MQPSRPDPPADRVGIEAHGPELPDVDQPALSAGELGDDAVRATFVTSVRAARASVTGVAPTAIFVTSAGRRATSVTKVAGRMIGRHGRSVHPGTPSPIPRA